MDTLRLLKIALLVAATAALTTATVLMVTQARVPATAVGPTPCLDGDVNGDSSLDIGDPIFLLGHLFGGGPAPIACAQTTPADIAAAVDAALGRYLPRAGERVYLLVEFLPGETGTVLTVPSGRVFVAEQYGYTSQVSVTGLEGVALTLSSTATISTPATNHQGSLTKLPGESVTATNNGLSNSGFVTVWGYWLDYP